MFQQFSRSVLAAGIAASVLIGGSAHAESKPVEPLAAAGVSAASAAPLKPAATDHTKYCVKTFGTGSRIDKMTCMPRSKWVNLHGIDPATLK